jgi:hypothetical protein
LFIISLFAKSLLVFSLYTFELITAQIPKLLMFLNQFLQCIYTRELVDDTGVFQLIGSPGIDRPAYGTCETHLRRYEATKR